MLKCSIDNPFRRRAARGAKRDPFPHRDGERLDARLYFVVGVLAVVAVEMQREAPVLGEGTQELGEQLHVEGPDLLGHLSEVARKMAPATKIHHGRTEGLDERGARVGKAHDAAPVAQRLVEGTPQNEPRVLDRVMVVHPRVAFRLYSKVHAGVLGEKVQQMVQEPHTRRDLAPALAVYLYVDLYISFGCLTLSTTLTRHLPPHVESPGILADDRPLAPLLYSRRDARGVVFEAFETGEAFDVGTEVSQGVLGEVDVVGSRDEVVGAEGRGPGRRAAGREGVGGTGGVVAEGDGAEISDGDHAGGVEVLEDGLVVLGDYVRVLRGVEVADLYSLLQVLDAYEDHVFSGLAG